ncbi:hypothetical protein C348_02571 [Cryptococcus neoformans Gb118]|nr:hypothetical protein C348_02571 [Cryptococcus neoformans var. grubii Gb118]
MSEARSWVAEVTCLMHVLGRSTDISWTMNAIAMMVFSGRETVLSSLLMSPLIMLIYTVSQPLSSFNGPYSLSLPASRGAAFFLDFYWPWWPWGSTF